MNAMVSIVGTIVLIVALALLGLALTRRLVPTRRLAQHTDVAGYVYAVLGVLFAVILAQVVIASWEDYRDARDAAAAEADAVLNLARLARIWPDADQTAVETALAAYARNVVEVEWPAMGRGEFAPEMQTAQMQELWQSIGAAGQGQATEAGAAVFAEALTQLDSLDGARRARVLLGENGLPTTMTLTLILGAVVTVGFSYLFAVEEGWVHALMTASLAVLSGLLLLLAHELEAPFSGVARIEPTAMEYALAEIESGPRPEASP
jgi:hypothetical protein